MILRAPPSSGKTLGRELYRGCSVCPGKKNRERLDFPTLLPPQTQRQCSTPACETGRSGPFYCDLNQRKIATGLEIFALTAQSHSMGDVNIWPAGTWVAALPIGANCTESLESQVGLSFVVCVFFNPLLFCVTVRGCQKPGGAEGFQQCLPGGFLSRRQMGVCWALQLHYRETDPGSPVSTARSQLALGVRGIACSSPKDYKHPPTPM